MSHLLEARRAARIRGGRRRVGSKWMAAAMWFGGRTIPAGELDKVRAARPIIALAAKHPHCSRGHGASTTDKRVGRVDGWPGAREGAEAPSAHAEVDSETRVV